MNPSSLRSYLSKLIADDLKMSVMIWGTPGIGKSSIVAQVATSHQLGFIDLRLSQLAPTDLRGLPVPVDGVSKWYPPEFLPRDGKGILFLDELNMAPPALQGIAQQLILDRRVGAYAIPDGWFIWAAGNRKEDRASVFDMPAPLGNRFIHLETEPDFDAFKAYAIERGLHEQIIAFLSFRPTLLHKIDPQRPAWPSPRSWEMASQLHAKNLSISPAVGDASSVEFAAFLAVYKHLAIIDEILAGRGDAHAFPDDPSMRYAITVALSLRISTAEQAVSSFRWLKLRAQAEWVQLWGTNTIAKLRANKQMGMFAQAVQADPGLQAFVTSYQEMIKGASI